PAFVHDVRHHLVEAAGRFIAGDIRLLAFPECANGFARGRIELLPVGDGFVGVLGHVRLPLRSSHTITKSSARKRRNDGRKTQAPCASECAACALMVFTIEASPFERVGERCLPSPIALMKDGSVSRISRALCPE